MNPEIITSVLEIDLSRGDKFDGPIVRLDLTGTDLGFVGITEGSGL